MGTPTNDVISGQVTILLQDNEFHPQKLTVKAGTKVSWINKDPQFRTIRSDNGLFQSNPLAIGQIFSFTFDKPGTYNYYCEPGGGPGGEGSVRGDHGGGITACSSFPRGFSGNPLQP